MIEKCNLFDVISADLPDELCDVLLERDHVRIERIVSRGHASPGEVWYDQERDEWVALLSGAARLEFDDGRTLEMTPGDCVLLPAHCRHRVAWTAPDIDTVWLAVHV